MVRVINTVLQARRLMYSPTLQAKKNPHAFREMIRDLESTEELTCYHPKTFTLLNTSQLDRKSTPLSPQMKLEPYYLRIAHPGLGGGCCFLRLRISFRNHVAELLGRLVGCWGR